MYMLSLVLSLRNLPRYFGSFILVAATLIYDTIIPHQVVVCNVRQITVWNENPKLCNH